MDTFLRPKEIAKKLGVSNSLTSKFIGKSKCREKKEDGKMVFCYEDVCEFIKKQV